MSSATVKAAVILATAIIAAVAIWIYFSPYHSCIRSQTSKSEAWAARACAHAAAGG